MSGTIDYNVLYLLSSLQTFGSGDHESQVL